jgi:DNA modification methylase
MKQLKILDLLPADLRFDVIEDITAKVNLQSVLARKQLEMKRELEKHTNQGKRIDLRPEGTCTPDNVQVGRRRESTVEKVAACYGECAGAVRARVTVYQYAEADTVKYGKYLKQMDEEDSPYRAWTGLKAALQAEKFGREQFSQERRSRVRYGDIWRLGDHRLACGDATSAADVGWLLSGAVPHLMVTDPPYGVGYDPAWRAKKIGNKNDNKMGIVANDDRCNWSEALALFPGNVAYVWFADLHANVVQASLENNGLEVRNLIVWEKKRPVISRGHYSHDAEFCFYAVRQGKRAHWNTRRSQSNVWKIDNCDDRGHGHGTQKPVGCMLRAIQHNSRQGDAVYDPFVGSGTTIIAAEESGRRCYAMDIEPRYCAIAIERWQNWTGQEAVLEATGEPYSHVMEARKRAAAAEAAGAY